MKRLNPARFSETFDVRRLEHQDVEKILQLYQSNSLYFHYCPPQPDLKSIEEDLSALPSGKTLADKYFVGFWQGEILLAVADVIVAYPDEQTAFLGLFMVDGNYHHQGIGRSIISDLSTYLQENVSFIRLGLVKGNLPAEQFWQQMGFKATGQEVKQELYNVLVLEKRMC